MPGRWMFVIASMMFRSQGSPGSAARCLGFPPEITLTGTFQAAHVMNVPAPVD